MSISKISGHLTHDAKIILVPVFLIMLAELLLLMGQDYISIWMHVGIILCLPFASIYLHNREITMAFQSLMLLSALRLLNISMPVFFETTLYIFIFIYTPLVIPIYIVLKAQDFQFSFRLSDEMKKDRVKYSLIAVIVALAIAEGEYAIIKAGSLIPDLSFMSLLQLSIVMIFFVGLIEEVIFRYILQTRLERTFGIWPALLIASALFGVMHSGYGTIYEVLMTASAGLVIGYLYVRTRSLYLVTMIHGLTNVFLFGIIPHLGPGLGLF
ncbi:CPBP family intramembrane glutamic endopeptidase [Methanolobus sp.]|uniref:CPBP family intramembrane glutamic endopeptidase n=1 Tax=Methanolobus sp. TaxID=1874737 RepID=UPI0025D66D5D|nr:CPBP family intramembrane glutamic endopeptidase [Methanolobus sp.]